MSKGITIKEKIYIARSPEVVWDYTQDYSRRHLWDRSVISARVIQEEPVRVVEIRARGRMRARFQYKYGKRPHKTTLAMIQVESPFVVGGGGSWVYEPESEGTWWTQVNTLILKENLLVRLLRPMIVKQLRQGIRSSMEVARRIIEGEERKLLAAVE
ncbi:MAG: SRPBCC family protein [Candidatus Kapaibacterium sp.]|nr:SRPBCC family protein [Ignavibacteria bacterium]